LFYTGLAVMQAPGMMLSATWASARHGLTSLVAAAWALCLFVVFTLAGVLQSSALHHASWRTHLSRADHSSCCQWWELLALAGIRVLLLVASAFELHRLTDRIKIAPGITSVTNSTSWHLVGIPQASLAQASHGPS
jgi:hypothetical protein